jgi:6-phosphogluconolactonase
MVANYNGGNAAVFPISPDGTLDQPSAFVQSKGSSINAVRQSGPHAHSIQPSPDNRFVLITDLGIDKVLIYSFDEKTGFLEGNDSMHASLTPGSGPRHLSFAPSGKYAFVINELSSTATVSSWDALTGRMVPGQSISTLPDNFTGTNTGAEILTVNGKYLYTSNRGDDSITLFNIDGIDGHLTQVERVSSGGLTPRHFEIDPTGRWLLAANQGSGKLVLFSIEPSSGRLKTSGKQLDQPSPVCVRFIPVH